MALDTEGITTLIMPETAFTCERCLVFDELTAGGLCFDCVIDDDLEEWADTENGKKAKLRADNAEAAKLLAESAWDSGFAWNTEGA